MVKRVIWTSQADRIFTQILEFYIKRNGSKTYSRKLNNEVHSLIAIIAKRPFLGIKTYSENERVFIKGDYKIFYKIESDQLIILLVWDCRQDLKDLKL